LISTGFSWYGKLLAFIVKGDKKEGTNKFIRFATISIVVEGERFIVDAIPVTPLTSNMKVVRELLGVASFITSLPVDDMNREKLAEDYRRRWGIETSYRMKNQFKAKTCSRCYPVRYVLYMLSICMYNLWVLLNILHAEHNNMASGKPTITVDSFIFDMRRIVYKTPS